MKRLGIFLICIVLTMAATVFSIWYNLHKVSAEPPDNLFGFIRKRLETGFQESGAVSNQ